MMLPAGFSTPPNCFCTNLDEKLECHVNYVRLNLYLLFKHDPLYIESSDTEKKVGPY